MRRLFPLPPSAVLLLRAPLPRPSSPSSLTPLLAWRVAMFSLHSPQHFHPARHWASGRKARRPGRASVRERTRVGPSLFFLYFLYIFFINFILTPPPRAQCLGATRNAGLHDSCTRARAAPFARKHQSSDKTLEGVGVVVVGGWVGVRVVCFQLCLFSCHRRPLLAGPSVHPPHRRAFSGRDEGSTPARPASGEARQSLAPFCS